MAVAIASRLGELPAFRCLADNGLLTSRLRRSSVPGPKHTSIVHLAQTSRAGFFGAPFDSTDPPHTVEGIKPL